ncbi:hypothetical protein Btru_007459 [Bulinus truncatus]|nr:hypothetical protein Btru_007459 [Bulinus truncatus]
MAHLAVPISYVSGRPTYTRSPTKFFEIKFFEIKFFEIKFFEIKFFEIKFFEIKFFEPLIIYIHNSERRNLPHFHFLVAPKRVFIFLHSAESRRCRSAVAAHLTDQGSSKCFNQPIGGNELQRCAGIASMMRLPVQTTTEGLDVCFVGVPFRLRHVQQIRNKDGTKTDKG